jgi:hypothetical protein
MMIQSQKNISYYYFLSLLYLRFIDLIKKTNLNLVKEKKR